MGILRPTSFLLRPRPSPLHFLSYFDSTSNDQGYASYTEITASDDCEGESS